MSGQPEWAMPVNVVDQYAARLRDSGLPAPVVRLVASTLATVLGQLADRAEVVAREQMRERP